jgi:hypothetical protein
MVLPRLFSYATENIVHEMMPFVNRHQKDEISSKTATTAIAIAMNSMKSIGSLLGWHVCIIGKMVPKVNQNSALAMRC